jgi:hypothetical protein
VTDPVSGPESPQDVPGLSEPGLEPLRAPETPQDPRTEHRDSLPRIDSLEVAVTQPHAMVNAAGEVFYPDDLGDAIWFAEQHGAWFLYGPTP